VIYTSFYEDINKIIEDISFRADSYWGEPGKFLFKARIDSFPITNEINDGVDRRFLSSFNLIMNGYLTPSNIGKHLAANALKYRSKSQLLFTMEASSQDVEQVTFKAAVKPKKALTSYIPEGVNVTNINSITNIFSGSLDNSTVVYLNTSETKKADAGSMTSDTATFLNTSFKQPPSGSGLPPTSVSDFKFFVNGIYVDNTYVVTFLESGSNTVLTVNTGSLGYILDNQDDVVAVGKFQ
jgi:hypothetical protein